MTLEVFFCFLVLCFAGSFGFAATLSRLDSLKDEIRNLKKELKNKEK
jgi:hypothetical protein